MQWVHAKPGLGGHLRNTRTDRSSRRDATTQPTPPAGVSVLAMSTLAQAQPATGDGAPSRLISLPLALTFLAEFTSLTSFFLLLSVMPMLAAAAGAGSSGAGFGVIENATFALLIEQLPEAKASTLWNLAYDAGYGAGPAVFGLFAARTGYPVAFALTGILVLAVLPAALREQKAVASPVEA
jgi:MFS family permease